MLGRFLVTGLHCDSTAVLRMHAADSTATARSWREYTQMKTHLARAVFAAILQLGSHAVLSPLRYEAAAQEQVLRARSDAFVLRRVLAAHLSLRERCSYDPH